ncbi:hypothetical protein ACFPOI_25855 [Nonomuraea angiospora]|uniref:Uncharacterized protein n=1 Tax=Nonomuraea angiospora TaxID=46172 RepID=A0ABR9LP34_9ACTN|nr:hypothetical protein [Nonomuraea angiospora]MBE1582414.1 hypothetical protein [Nonomuraea angiospora]
MKIAQSRGCTVGLIEVPEVLRLLEKEASHYSGSARSLQPRAWTDDEDPEFEGLAYVPYHVYKKSAGTWRTFTRLSGHAPSVMGFR